MVVSRVLGDIDVTPSTYILRRGQGCDPVGGWVSVGGERLVSPAVEESDSMESFVVMGCVSVSAMTNTRPGTLWRAPSPLAVRHAMD